ncbi:MAG TPA: hypothetical protein VGF13_16705 [Verrucomicrobiae bacterium]
MPAAFPIRRQTNWRQESANTRMAVALAISLVVHALIYTGWQVAPQAAAFLKNLGAAILPRKLVALPPKPKMEEPPPPKREVAMTFVEVDPAHATPEPPKETKNYSTANSIAANPIPKEAEVPKIEGSQTHVVRTMDVPKPQPKPLEPKPPEPKPPEPKPLEPSPPEPKPVETKQPEPEAKPPPKPPPPGDLALNKSTPQMLVPTLKPESEKPVEKPREKPRTLADARARNPALAGEKVKQDGGVERRAHVSMLDARRSEFGDYDAVFIGIVQARWYQLLENNKYMLDRRGKVSLTFRLYQDGRISQVAVAENTVGDMLSLLCQKAVLDPAPFPPWPKEMRRQIKVQSDNEHRDVKFTFYYD